MWPARRIDDADADGDPTADAAQEIYDAVSYELRPDAEGPCGVHQGDTRIESVYSVARAISGTPLRDSFHLGSTIVNDYGRPYENGFNNYSGASGYATAGRFTLYVRGEFQGAPSATGYSAALAETLSAIDGTTTISIPPPTAPFSQATIPMGPIGTATNGRFLEAYVSAQMLNHVISFGKQDEWLGPAMGGGMAYSNNAENIYSFRINRIEPLHIPLLSRLTGPFRYEFLVGALRGHTLMPNPAYAGGPSDRANVINPGDPWVHVEKISFRPTENLEFGFERTVIFGGEGHSPVTLHTFLKSFFSTSLARRIDVKELAATIPARVLAHSTSPTGCPSSAIGSRSIPTRKCTTTFRRSTLRGAPPGGPAFISPMFRAFPSSISASKPPSTDPPRPRRSHSRQLHVLGSPSRDRATPTRASSSATGSGARTRAARPGSPIT